MMSKMHIRSKDFYSVIAMRTQVHEHELLLGGRLAMRKLVKAGLWREELFFKRITYVKLAKNEIKRCPECWYPDCMGCGEDV
jgi:sigma54-dependent transcription regulator